MGFVTHEAREATLRRTEDFRSQENLDGIIDRVAKAVNTVIECGEVPLKMVQVGFTREEVNKYHFKTVAKQLLDASSAEYGVLLDAIRSAEPNARIVNAYVTDAGNHASLIVHFYPPLT